MVKVSVLFARADSIYKNLGLDVWDAERDARNFSGSWPVVAHPPCRAWGKLKSFAKPRPDEKELAVFAVNVIRANGGVLEHPLGSGLWPYMGLPRTGQQDKFGGWTLPVCQHWWGHRAEKRTLFYIVGRAPGDVPEIPFCLGEPLHVIAQARTLKDGSRLKKGMPGWRPEVSKAEREHTPERLARWLVELAGGCAVGA